ncbi:MAG: methyltransferase FkbM family [Gemmatimonadetes bacterium]|nr:methyltransferase FkbM family [Gemmatimonadota bacterium]
MLERPPVVIRLLAALVRRLPAGRYRVMDRVARPAPPPFIARTPVDAGGHAFHCDLRDGIAREVCFTGAYEPLETAIVRALLPAGGTFVDVGANWGYFTLLAAHIADAAGRVVALEPDPRLFALLRSNAERNRLSHVTPLQLAAAARRGTLTLAGFDEAGDNWGLSSLAATGRSDARGSAESIESTDASGSTGSTGSTGSMGSAGPRFEVATAALDDVLDDLSVDSVDLVKVDVEGAEPLVLRGMERGIAAGRYRALLLELHPSLVDGYARFERGVRERMSAAGYQGWWIDHSPAAARAASYARRVDLRRYLRPVDASAAPADAWPHQLWLLPPTTPFA